MASTDETPGGNSTPRTTDERKVVNSCSSGELPLLVELEKLLFALLKLLKLPFDERLLEEARDSSASTSSPRYVVFPSRDGSESARSIRRGLPPASTPFRFRTADNAVS